MWRAEESCAHNAGPGSAGESGVTARRSLRGSSAAIACGKRQSAALPLSTWPSSAGPCIYRDSLAG